MSLPAAGPLKLAGIDVGDGRPISPDPSFSERSGPVLWLSTALQNDGGKRWSALRKAFPQTGLWPLLVGGLKGEPDRPWLTGELSPAPVVEDDAGLVLARCWSEGMPGQLEEELDDRELEPFGRDFPGLAVVSGKPQNEDVIDRVAKDISRGRRLALVEVSRPADAPAVVGWEGAVNVIDSGTVSAILRSWEDRFDALLVGAEFDTLTLAVRRPPTRDDESLRVAAEHYAFCFDNIAQGVGSIRAYAKALTKQSRWEFWWD